MNLSLFMITTALLGSNMEQNNRYLISSENITYTQFNGYEGSIDIYYSIYNEPSTRPFLQVLVNNSTLLVNHQLLNDSLAYGSSTVSTRDDIYLYSIPIENWSTTTTYYFYLSWNNVSYLGESYSFDIVFNVFNYNDGGYYNGYTDGIEIGYETGYNNGYTDGTTDYQNSVENTNNIIDTIWDFLSNGVQTCLNIFSYPILPGIPLYMLIAIPFIVAIFIFITKALSK